MKNRLFFTLAFLWLTSAALMAQNRIDKYMEKNSTVGKNTYTCVVMRDPKTHEVTKKVNVLSVEGPDANELYDIFMSESKKYNTMTTTSNRQTTTVFTTRNSSYSTIYTLEYTQSPKSVVVNNAKAIVIIQYNTR